MTSYFISILYSFYLILILILNHFVEGSAINNYNATTKTATTTNNNDGDDGDDNTNNTTKNINNN